MANQIQVTMTFEDIFEVLKAHTEKLNEEEPTDEEIDSIIRMAEFCGYMSYSQIKFTLEELRGG